MKLYSKPLKTKLSFTAILLAFLMAYAWFLIVLALIVAVVAGVIVYELYHVAVRLLPKEPAVTNNAVEIVNGNSVRMKSLPQPFDETPSNATPSTFTFQYGVSNVAGIRQPWTIAGSNLASSVDGQTDCIINTTNEFNFSITYAGWSYQYDYDGNGNEIFETNYPPQGVVVFRSTDLINWVPIYTNLQRGMNTVNTFTDSNPPPMQASYLVIPQTSP